MSLPALRSSRLAPLALHKSGRVRSATRKSQLSLLPLELHRPPLKQRKTKLARWQPERRRSQLTPALNQLGLQRLPRALALGRLELHRLWLPLPPGQRKSPRAPQPLELHKSLLELVLQPSRRVRRKLRLGRLLLGLRKLQVALVPGQAGLHASWQVQLTLTRVQMPLAQCSSWQVHRPSKRARLLLELHTSHLVLVLIPLVLQMLQPAPVLGPLAPRKSRQVQRALGLAQALNPLALCKSRQAQRAPALAPPQLGLHRL